MDIVKKLLNKEPFILRRDQAYIGVVVTMIDLLRKLQVLICLYFRLNKFVSECYLFVIVLKRNMHNHNMLKLYCYKDFLAKKFYQVHIPAGNHTHSMLLGFFLY